MAVAAILGTYIYAGLTTLSTTQNTVGSMNATANLFSINTGVAAAFPADVALFQPVALQPLAAANAVGIGFGAYTVPATLFTLSGPTSVWYQGNTTAMAGMIFQPFLFSGIR